VVDDSNQGLDPGVNFLMDMLIETLGLTKDQVTWDAATETYDGDVQAVLSGILRLRFGEYFDPRTDQVVNSHSVPIPRNEAEARAMMVMGWNYLEETETEWKFGIGARVQKPNGYGFPGIVVARYTSFNKKDERYVVECVVEGAKGWQHIFAPNQLELDKS
jgi:hypothetical protein